MLPETPRFSEGAGFLLVLGAGVPSLEDGVDDSCFVFESVVEAGLGIDASCLGLAEAAGSCLAGFEGAGAGA